MRSCVSLQRAASNHANLEVTTDSACRTAVADFYERVARTSEPGLCYVGGIQRAVPGLGVPLDVCGS
ncbi:MAG: hypothetical protein NVSMB19_24140 [Vulcanimicrobiaceae bacterium]